MDEIYIDEIEFDKEESSNTVVLFNKDCLMIFIDGQWIIRLLDNDTVETNKS